MQFHEKIDLFDFKSFFAWTFLNFLVRCGRSRTMHKSNETISKDGLNITYQLPLNETNVCSFYIYNSKNDFIYLIDNYYEKVWQGEKFQFFIIIWF